MLNCVLGFVFFYWSLPTVTLTYDTHLHLPPIYQQHEMEPQKHIKQILHLERTKSWSKGQQTKGLVFAALLITLLRHHYSSRVNKTIINESNKWEPLDFFLNDKGRIVISIVWSLMHEGFLCKDWKSVIVQCPVKENLLKKGNLFLKIILDNLKNSADCNKPFNASHIKKPFTPIKPHFSILIETRLRLHKNMIH